MFNSAIEKLTVYTSKAVARESDSDPEIVNLSIGEPDFGPPPFAAELFAGILEPARYISDLKRYETSRGSSPLRDAIAAYYARYHGLAIDPAGEILVTHGGVGALALAILAGTSENDEIVISDPSYMLYERQVRALGRTPCRVSRALVDGFSYNVAGVASALGPRTRMLIVNSPENPTGYICSDDEMCKLIVLCRERNIWLLHDEVYDQHALSRQHRPARWYAQEDDPVLLANSCSKKLGVPGLRIGWLAAPARFIAVASKAHDYLYLSVGRTAEALAALLLTDPATDAWYAEVRCELEARFDLVLTALASIDGIEAARPHGGLFLFPRVRRFAERLTLGGDDAGALVSRWLAQKLKIASVSGSAYGDAGRDYLRLTVCAERERLRVAVQRLASVADRTPQSIPY